VLHSENPVYGTALNPHDQTRTCGGSSGGDAGLVAAKCVPLSVGTDSGGSIRAPSIYTGVVGFKPTAERTQFKGIISGVPLKRNPQSFLGNSCGPICQTVDDAKMFFETSSKLEHLKKDFDTSPLPFNDDLYKECLNKKMTFAFLEDLGDAPTSLSVKRAM